VSLPPLIVGTRHCRVLYIIPMLPETISQENLLFVEQASCLFKKGLLTMVQDLSLETMRVIGTLTPRLRCKLNPVQLNVMELGAIKSPIASLHAIFRNSLLERHTTK